MNLGWTQFSPHKVVGVRKSALGLPFWLFVKSLLHWLIPGSMMISRDSFGSLNARDTCARVPGLTLSLTRGVVLCWATVSVDQLLEPGTFPLELLSSPLASPWFSPETSYPPRQQTHFARFLA